MLAGGLDAYGAKATRVKEDCARRICRQVVGFVALFYFWFEIVRKLVKCGPFCKGTSLYKELEM